MVEIRRKRGQGIIRKETPQQPIVQTEKPEEVTISEKEIQEEESQDWISRAALRQDQGTFTTAKGINEISAELTDDRRSALVESNYWDETHNWGSDHELASEDYWHFVGRYE